MNPNKEELMKQFIEDLFLEELFKAYSLKYTEIGRPDPNDYRWSLYGNEDSSELCEENIELIEAMIADIKDLQEEVVRLRYIASHALKPPYDEYLRADGMNNMPISIPYSEKFQEYIEKWHRGKDPLQENKHKRRCKKLINGKSMADYIAMMK